VRRYTSSRAARGCETIYIEPGSPWENPYIESFNGKLRDECLNMCVFKNVEEAQDVVERWRIEYNSQRPHSALGYTTPEKVRKDIHAGVNIPFVISESAGVKVVFFRVLPSHLFALGGA